MGYHSYPYMGAKFFFNEEEEKWLERELDIVNFELGQASREDYDLAKTKTLEGKTIISPEKGIQYFLDCYGVKVYLHDLEPRYAIQLCEQGIYYSYSNDEIELSEKLIQEVCKLLQRFLNQFNKSDTIRLLAHITNNRDDTKKDGLLFIGAKISKNEIQIMNLLSWLFENEEINIPPEYNYIYDY